MVHTTIRFVHTFFPQSVKAHNSFIKDKELQLKTRAGSKWSLNSRIGSDLHVASCGREASPRLRNVAPTV